MSDKTKKINIEVELDKKNIPENITWNATDLNGYDEAHAGQ
jgi:hypothetical protein